jgi:glycerol-3-phosphate acyltransferase PlsY
LGAAHGIAILASLLGGLGAFLGHLFPVWLGFKGGKGVATYIGVLIGAAWQAALVFCGVWLAVAILTRYSSLSALVASVLTPLALEAMGARPAGLLALVMTALLVWRHRGNIARLVKGEEPRIGARS